MEDKIIKNCGFVIRVSTDKQARNPEGSLTNQLQRLQAHIEYKTNACGERWVETGRYILKGISGKDSFRSIEFTQLLEDIKSGKVNTVICTALDRISRSVRDFLNFFEILTKYDVEFVCLKQNYDTTSSQGKLFITIMMALAEFERTQTSERNKEATLARAERGLWNGGHLLGYNLDPNRKGYPIVNEKEKALVRFAFKKYLECGSLMETTRALNSNGYRTKGYTSRRGKFRTPEKFGRSSMKQLLVNCAYIGLKEINKKKRLQDQTKLQEKERYRTVKAVWEPLLDEETFYKVQKLLKQNTKTKHNGTKIIKHTYILNGGLLWCGKCGSQMEGTCGTGRRGNKYFFYVCKDKDCRFKLPADEIERIIIERIKYLSSDSGLMQKLIEHTNDKLMKELPQLKCRRTHLQKELAEAKAFADGIMNKWTAMATDDSSIFLKEKLAELGQRRKEIETGIASLEAMIKEIERESISQELVTLALNRFSDLFDKIKPYRQKDMVRLVLHKATLSPSKMQIALYGRQPDTGLLDLCKSDNEEIRCQMSNWLRTPTTKRFSNILKVKFPVYLMYYNKNLRIIEGEIPFGIKTDKRITRRLLRENKPIIAKPSPLETALEYARVYAEPSIISKLQVAQRFGVTRARVCQMLNLLNLDKRIIEYLLNIKDAKERNFWTERRLRQITIVKEQDEQIRKFSEIINNMRSSIFNASAAKIYP